MVAEVSRIGSGGITVKVAVDKDNLRRQAGELKRDAQQLAAEIAKEMKVKVGVDFDETAIRREVTRIGRRVERAAILPELLQRLESRGLLSAAVEAGAVRAPAVSMSPLEQLAMARGLTRTGAAGGGIGTGGMLGGLAAYRFGLGAVAAGAFGVDQTMTGIGGLIGASNMSESQDMSVQIQARMKSLEAKMKIPLAGTLLKLLDRWSDNSITKSIEMELIAERFQRGTDAGFAALTRNPRRVAEVQQAAELRKVREEFAQKGVIINDNGGQITATGGFSEIATQAALQAYRKIRDLTEERVNRAGLEFASGQNLIRAQGESERLQRERRPMDAARAMLVAQMESDVALAPPEMQELVGRLGRARLSRFDVERMRAVELDQSLTSAVLRASQMKVEHHGISLADDQAEMAIAGIRREIALTPAEDGAQERARLRGLAELRAAKASLMVRGGGFGAVTNLATNLVGDPFNLMPEEKARGRAIKRLDEAIGNIGSASDADLGARSPGETTGLLRSILEEMQRMNQRLDDAAVLRN